MNCPNVKECPCDQLACPNHAHCCLCVINHKTHGLPYCLRKNDETKQTVAKKKE